MLPIHKSYNMDIPIVVVAYNRPGSLQRLLNSLERAAYPIPVKLYISIDGGGNQDVFNLASRFSWKHGEKKVIRHSKNLGLKKHVLSCADKALEHDGIIILEDDLQVSPSFYSYTRQAAHYYKDDKKIAGVSLYSHRFNESAQMPFIPLQDGSDIFFMQLASSWGQIFTKEQWVGFRSWYQHNSRKTPTAKEGIPASIIQWPEASWKKYFIRYMIVNNLYFVYPRISYSTNFGDNGTHHLGDNHYQAPLAWGNKSASLTLLDKSLAVYDSFCEILPCRLNRLTGQFSNYHYSVDLYGQKNLGHLSSEYILTSKGSNNPIYKYGCKMIPHEANVISGIKGEQFHFARLADTKTEIRGYTNARVVYYHGLPRWHLKEKGAGYIQPQTLNHQEETLLRIYSKSIGKLFIVPLLYFHRIFVGVRNLVKKRPSQISDNQL